MRLLVVSDLHGDLDAAWAAVEAARPDVLLSCGDWGDPEQVSLNQLQEFTARLPVHTVSGNHDPLEVLPLWVNEDGTPVLFENGESRRVGALTIVGINGIWAKSHRKPFYVTDEEVDEAAMRAVRSGSPDILLTHGCPAGVADLTLDNRHGGRRCWLRAFQILRPRLYLNGHLHRTQEYHTRDGSIVRNVGVTPAGEATLIEAENGEIEVTPLRFRNVAREPAPGLRLKVSG